MNKSIKRTHVVSLVLTSQFVFLIFQFLFAHNMKCTFKSFHFWWPNKWLNYRIMKTLFETLIVWPNQIQKYSSHSYGYEYFFSTPSFCCYSIFYPEHCFLIWIVDSTNNEYFSLPMGILVESIYGNTSQGSTMLPNNIQASAPISPLRMSLLDSLTVHAKMR